jgi:hypothetical protein
MDRGGGGVGCELQQTPLSLPPPAAAVFAFCELVKFLRAGLESFFFLMQNSMELRFCRTLFTVLPLQKNLMFKKLVVSIFLFFPDHVRYREPGMMKKLQTICTFQWKVVLSCYWK